MKTIVTPADLPEPTTLSSSALAGAHKYPGRAATLAGVRRTLAYQAHGPPR